MVLLVRTLANGDVTEEWMIPFLAVEQAFFSPLNGAEVRSARLIWGKVSCGTSDASGGGFAAEWSMMRKPYVDDANWDII